MPVTRKVGPKNSFPVKPFLLAGLLLSTNALADTSLTLPLASYHFERRGYCELNPGLGVERGGRDFRMIAGTYRNSLCESSAYIGISYAPLKQGRLRFGFAGVVFTGYKDRAILTALPVAAYEERRWGVNLVLVPPKDEFKGAVGLQVKWRLR